MWGKSSEGSTHELLQLCFFLFFFYVINGVVVKYFQFYPGGPQLSDITYTVYSTIGGASIPLIVILVRKWYKFKSAQLIHWGKIKFPSEFLYILPAGLCTAIVVVFTTLMYSFKDVSIMVAMIIMRGSIIVIGRIVDAIQIKQGILHKKVYAEENWGVFLAVLAVAADLVFVKTGDFAFMSNPWAMFVLCTYVVAYAFRIYIMNYFKNTRPPHMHYETKGYFAIEQIFFMITALILAVIIFHWPNSLGGNVPVIQEFRNTITHPNPFWAWAILGGTAYGLMAFFSVFVFMFKGRTATFSSLVNRLTTLIAGTVATLLSWLFFTGKFPVTQDWLSLILIFISIAFITKAEKKRVKELVRHHELPKNAAI